MEFKKEASNSIPAVGGAPGDETTKIFLENWGLLKKLEKTENLNCYFPRLIGGIEDEALIESIRKSLIKNGFKVNIGYDLERFSGSIFSTAQKRGYNFVVIFGEDEKKLGIYKIKDLDTREEVSLIP